MLVAVALAVAAAAVTVTIAVAVAAAVIVVTVTVTVAVAEDFSQKEIRENRFCMSFCSGQRPCRVDSNKIVKFSEN